AGSRLAHTTRVRYVRDVRIGKIAHSDGSRMLSGAAGAARGRALCLGHRVATITFTPNPSPAVAGEG
ncbi:MAG TPA: hypothetical protein VKB09_02820, partial [Thermomicrobiales bacterium]|nr:hypothetical protein [Thermomicrobiales bacterium]